ncbi:MAG: Sec-independent protein translocase TatB [Yaniella sp.]|nr:Sec-independent protein translocase TatB [Yaniella sp.]
MNIFGINGGELIVLVVLALMLLGPEKIPQYLRTLREWIHKARVFAEGAKDQFKEETGTDFDEVDWQKYDPRQYDPRRVIREALSEPIEELEASMKDVKSTVQDAADTVTNEPVARPALSQA